jgi:hypothetical protein
MEPQPSQNNIKDFYQCVVEMLKKKEEERPKDEYGHYIEPIIPRPLPPKEKPPKI